MLQLAKVKTPRFSVPTQVLDMDAPGLPVLGVMVNVIVEASVVMAAPLRLATSTARLGEKF
jgi:hypothetical protein